MSFDLNNYLRFIFLAFIFLKPALAQAASVTTGYLAPGAVSQGLGGAHAALGDSSADFMLNPAILARHNYLNDDLESGSLFGGSEFFLGDTLVIPAIEDLVMALGVQKLWTGQSDHFQQQWMAALGIPLREGGESSLGVTIKYIESDYGDPGQCMGLDIGLLHRIAVGNSTLALSLSVLDVDSVLVHQSGIEERIPQVIKVGIGLERGTLRFAVDNDFIDAGSAAGSDRQYALHAGIEKGFWNDQLLARIGYVSLSEFNSSDSIAPISDSGRATFGLGLHFGRLKLDYAFLPGTAGVNASHRLSLNFNFDTKEEQADQIIVPKPLQPLKITKSLRGDKMVWLVWDDPQGKDDISYVILTGARPDSIFSRLAQTGGGQRALELRGLENGRVYYFKIASMDAQGRGIDATLCEIIKLVPQAPAAEVAVDLDKASQAFEAGHMDEAMSWSLRARVAEPDRADTELLIYRLEQINSGGGR